MQHKRFKVMKKTSLHFLQFAILSIFLFQLAACGDDDDGSPAGLALEGTLWTQISFENTGWNDPADNESGTVTCTDTNCVTALFENGEVTYTEIEDGDTTSITFPVTITASTFSLLGQVANYNIVGNTLTISADDPFDGCTITEMYTGSN